MPTGSLINNVLEVVMDGFWKESPFWDRTVPTTVGDLINRPAALALLGDVKGKQVFDAGCGTGYLSRRLAEHGAMVTGIDTDAKILALASQKGGAFFCNGSVEKIPCVDNHFDKALCVSVLMYNSIEIVQQFYVEMKRVLKPGGELVVAVTHPYLGEPNSIAFMDDVLRWLMYEPLGGKANEYDLSPILYLRQKYFNIAGEHSTLEIQNHSVAQYVNLAIDAGLTFVRMNEIRFPKELASPLWGNEWGYPVYLHLKFRV